MKVKNYGKLLQISSELDSNFRLAITDVWITLEGHDSIDKIYLSWPELEQLLRDKYPDGRQSCELDLKIDDAKEVKIFGYKLEI